MVDISEKIGRVSCSELQKEFSANDVIFLPTDVTKRDQLVGHVVSQAARPDPFSCLGCGWKRGKRALWTSSHTPKQEKGSGLRDYGECW